MSAPTHSMTAEEFLAYAAGSDAPCELVRGEVVTMCVPGALHGEVAMLVGALLLEHVRARQLGIVRAESGFVLGRHPDTVRGPDVSFCSRDRDTRGNAGFIERGPDLVVEIRSPGDRPAEIAGKVDDYLAAGTRLVWVVDPEARTVVVHRRSGSPTYLDGSMRVEGEDVVPGFACDVRAFFPAE